MTTVMLHVPFLSEYSDTSERATAYALRMANGVGFSTARVDHLELLRDHDNWVYWMVGVTVGDDHPTDTPLALDAEAWGDVP